MKGILKKMPPAGMKRRLSFHPNVKDAEDELQPSPELILPGPGTAATAPSGEPISVAGPYAVPTPGAAPGPPGGPQSGQPGTVQDEEDNRGGALSEEDWPTNVGPLLACAVVVSCMAVLTVLVSYSSSTSSATVLPKSPSATGHGNNASEQGFAAGTESRVTVRVPAKGGGIGRGDDEYLTDYVGTQTEGFSEYEDVPKGLDGRNTTAAGERIDAEWGRGDQLGHSVHHGDHNLRRNVTKTIRKNIG